MRSWSVGEVQWLRGRGGEFSEWGFVLYEESGNLGGFFGPTVVGWAKNYTGGFSGGLYALAGFALMSAIVSALGLRIPNPAAGQEMAAVPAE